ncbi:MAG: glycoside hydrolase family 2 protein [Lachnospiraceae bacterium]|nr:glycoside hydrolase family 2 protein [Lachnospiraceae bacterium]
MRRTENFNKNWLFILDDNKAYAACGASEDGFRALNLPHDWAVDYEPDENEPSGGGGGYGKTGIGWYRKHFNIEGLREDEKVFFYFEGVYMDSAVYVNGSKAGGHGYGYSSFYVDATPYVQEGENVVAVRVNNSHAPNSRWYSGSGIYRDVYFIRTESVHFDFFGVRCATNGIYPEQDQATLEIKTAVTNDGSAAVRVDVYHRVYDAEGKEVSLSGIALRLAPGETSDCTARPTIESPHLWTDTDPYLYTLKTTLKVGDEVVDENCTRIGVRTATFDKDKGFLLNGKSVKIKGMCVHHDCGLTGAVGYRDSWERRLRTLKDMGCNGIRCAHNPPVPALLDLCDELGFLVMDEAFDEWRLVKNKIYNYYSEQLAYGSSLFFTNHAEEDMVTMLRRDYNHPSVIIWSIGNEIPEQSSLEGVKILNFLQDICHREDQSRMVTSACDNIVAVEPIRTSREFENALDVVGYNYVGRWRERAETFYDEDRHEFPNRRFIGTENPSCGGTRGDYSEEGSFFGRYATMTMWTEPLWRYTVSRDFVSGDYLWTGIDYLGETRWPSRGAMGAPIDSAGFKKDTFYYFRSIWNRDEITLHLLPSWNFEGSEGEYKEVVCYTSCDYVRLYINGKFVGERGYVLPRMGSRKSWAEGFGKKNHSTTNDLHLAWDVVYEPGVLRAEGYKDEQLVAVEEIATTGKTAAITAEAFKDKIKVDGLLQIEISAKDAEGRFVADADPVVSCRVEGPAHLVGMDAGNMFDLSLYTEPKRKMFNGLLLAAVQADAPGEIKVFFETESGFTAEVTATAE